MNTVKELYEKLSSLIEQHPEVGALNIDACGAPGCLFFYREEPDGPITGISYEDDTFIAEHEGNAEEWLKELGITTLPDQ